MHFSFALLFLVYKIPFITNTNVIVHIDWCGPCRRFTPELVSFHQKINKRRGSTDKFSIVWVSRCKDIQTFGQYFTHMTGFYAL